MRKRLLGAVVALGLALTAAPLASFADDDSPSPTPSVETPASPSPTGAETPASPFPTEVETPASPDPAEVASPESSPSSQPAEPSASPSAIETSPAPAAGGTPEAATPSAAPNARAAEPAAATSGTMQVGSTPSGFKVGSNYVFRGTTTAGSPVTVWWDAVPSGGWRKFGSTTAAADGSWRLVLPIGSSAAFSFVATGGAAPGGAGWTSAVSRVNAGSSAVLSVGSAPIGFATGGSFIFSGKATPNSKVVVHWDALPYRGWRPFGTTTADARGNYRIALPLGSIGRFKFVATAGHLPGTGAGAWETNPSYVNTVLPGTNSGVLTVGSNPAGFLVGHNYVFTGRTTPGMPVTIWWDAAPYKGWRVFASTKAGADGFYRVVLPIGSAATFRFAASSGHAPDKRTSAGWQTSAVGLTSTVYKAPTMKLDPRCMKGRVICISRAQSELAWVVNGKIQFTLDARFGSSKLPTRNGSFKVNWKSRNHVSSIYGSAMPFSLFFDGGRAVHYSRSFAEYGYKGNSAGCVNTRDYELTAKLFDLARVGDKVIVF